MSQPYLFVISSTHVQVVDRLPLTETPIPSHCLHTLSPDVANDSYLSDRVKLWAKAHASDRRVSHFQRPILPLQSPSGVPLSQFTTTNPRNRGEADSTSEAVTDSDVQNAPPALPSSTLSSDDQIQVQRDTLSSVERVKPRQRPGISTQLKDGTIMVGQYIKHVLFRSRINVLLVFVPAGIAVGYSGLDGTVVFAINAVAIIPLAALLAYATESVANGLGDTLGALLNVSFGNAVELIIL